MQSNQKKIELNPALQKIASIWPLIGAAVTVLAFGIGADARIGTNKDDIAGLKTRVDRLEEVLPGVKEDLATIKQQGADNGERLNHIEHRLDAEDRRTR